MLILALLLAASAQPARPAVALMPLRALGVPPEVARALQDTLQNELSALPEARIVPAADLAEALRREPDCEAHIACAAAAASKAGARQLIMGTASQLGDAFMIDLKLMDARSAAELRRATHPVSGTQDALIETLREAAVELLAPARFVGALRVDVPGVPGAQLFVDGKPAGKVPLEEPIAGLAPGQHTLRVADGRTREVSTFVEVRYGRTTEARVELGAVQLKTVPAAALPSVQLVSKHPWLRPAGYAGLGLGLAAAAIGAGYQVRAYATASEINRRESLNQLATTDLGAYNDVDHEVKIARGLYITGAILGAAGAGLLLWDWKFDGSSVSGRF